jgi:hypothetical protein
MAESGEKATRGRQVREHVQVVLDSALLVVGEDGFEGLARERGNA